MNISELQNEFDRQSQNLLQKGYPEIGGLSAESFKVHIEPLRKNLEEIKEIPDGHIPFVIVVKQLLIPAEKALPLIQLGNTTGSVNMYPHKPEDFTTIEEVTIPDASVYLLVDIDTGQQTLNVTPHDALSTIQKQNRSPLTIDEGVAIVTHFPEVLVDKEHYNSFSMLASRRGDQRVPALWISYGKPRLGWCWNNNPHTWLGSASCRNRI